MSASPEFTATFEIGIVFNEAAIGRQLCRCMEERLQMRGVLQIDERAFGEIEER